VRSGEPSEAPRPDPSGIGNLSITVPLGEYVQIGEAKICFLSRPSAGSGRQLRLHVVAPRSIAVTRTGELHPEEVARHG
jgi:hypothetical protein